MKNPTLSIVLTVFNKEFLIERLLDAILKNKSSVTKELILVFDGCQDNSEALAKEFLKDVKDISIIYEHADNVFETKANNIGLKRSSTNYSMIIQDDMLIEESGFDARMLKPFIFNDTFSVTSRMAHDDIIIDGRIRWANFAGFDPYNTKIMPSRRDMFCIRDICNRGPLVLDNEKLQTLGYLDEAFWPQNIDDHDVCLRAWKDHHWVSGSFWIKWGSDYLWGGSRDFPKKYEWLEECTSKNIRLLIERHYDLLQPDAKHDENRMIF